MIGERTRTIVIGVVTTVWAINFLAGIVVTGYEPSESINGIFMGIVGGLFALGARASSNDALPPRRQPPATKRSSPPEDDEGEPL